MKWRPVLRSHQDYQPACIRITLLYPGRQSTMQFRARRLPSVGCEAHHSILELLIIKKHHIFISYPKLFSNVRKMFLVLIYVWHNDHSLEIPLEYACTSETVYQLCCGSLYLALRLAASPGHSPTFRRKVWATSRVGDLDATASFTSESLSALRISKVSGNS